MTRDEKGRFVRGVSGNPKGRPSKEREIQYRDVLLTAISLMDWRKIVEKARDQALRGDAVARKWLADYLVGVPVQKFEHSGEDGAPISIQIIEVIKDGS